jgi:hypothetical protein
LHLAAQFGNGRLDFAGACCGVSRVGIFRDQGRKVVQTLCVSGAEGQCNSRVDLVDRCGVTLEGAKLGLEVLAGLCGRRIVSGFESLGERCGACFHGEERIIDLF